MNLKKVLVGALATTMVLGMSMVASAAQLASTPEGDETDVTVVQEESVTDFSFGKVWECINYRFYCPAEYSSDPNTYVKLEYSNIDGYDGAPLKEVATWDGIDDWFNLAKVCDQWNDDATFPIYLGASVDTFTSEENTIYLPITDFTDYGWNAEDGLATYAGYFQAGHTFYDLKVSVVRVCNHANAAADPKTAKAATCTADGKEADVVCPDCGKVTEGAVIPAAGHSADVVPAVDATCTATGLTEGSECSVCGEVLTAQTVVPALGHDWVDGEDCSRCGTPYCDHVDKGTDTANAIEATCTKPGYTGDTVCANCGEVLEKGEEVEALGHTPVDGEGKDATCTEDGLTNGSVCSVCDAVIEEQVVIPALGHNFVDGVCSVCGAEDPDAAPADPEDPAEEPTVAPTEEPTEAPSETPDGDDVVPPLGSAAPVAVAAMLALVAGAVVVSSKKRA